MDELPQDWIDLAMLMRTELPEMQKSHREVERHFEIFRRKHGYKKL